MLTFYIKVLREVFFYTSRNGGGLRAPLDTCSSFVEKSDKIFESLSNTKIFESLSNTS